MKRYHSIVLYNSPQFQNPASCRLHCFRKKWCSRHCSIVIIYYLCLWWILIWRSLLRDHSAFKYFGYSFQVHCNQSQSIQIWSELSVFPLLYFVIVFNALVKLQFLLFWVLLYIQRTFVILSEVIRRHEATRSVPIALYNTTNSVKP